MCGQQQLAKFFDIRWQVVSIHARRRRQQAVSFNSSSR
jgi:hypothetical protein